MAKARAKSKPKTTKAKAKGGYVAGQGTGPAVAAALSAKGKSPTSDASFGEELVKRKHQDWQENQFEWRFFLDSLEGGRRYTNAEYGPDRKGLPIRNLVRHKREYPDPQEFPEQWQAGVGVPGAAGAGGAGQEGYGPRPGQLGADPYSTAGDDDYEYRRARTVVPSLVEEACSIHVGKVYDQEVDRDGPDDLKNWWKDVDGKGTCIDDYMRETVAPLLLVLGTLDICMDHPRRPEGEQINSEADVLRTGINACVASYLLPENVVWWREDDSGRFNECLIKEYADASDRDDLDENGEAIDPEGESDASQSWRKNYLRWRHWTVNACTLYSYDGKEIVEEPIEYNYGTVPIKRHIAKKKHRTRNIGSSWYGVSASCQREIYNISSELVLSNTLQAQPYLSGPEEYCKADNTLSVGPGYLLPKKKNPENGHYEGFEYVSPPKDPAESLRKSIQDYRDESDRFNGLTKPAGVQGTTGGSVGQSGVSKQLDSVAGNKILRAIAMLLARAERYMAEYALMVLRNRIPTPAEKEQIKIGYPTKFDLASADEMLNNGMLFQQMLGQVGAAPNSERELLQAVLRQMMVGLDDEAYKVLDAEIEELCEERSQLHEDVRELQSDYINSSNALQGSGSSEQGAENDDSGQSAATAVSTGSSLIV